MDYFTILNLEREPFSNSPEPDLFYLSAQHRRCLQRMELAVRLRRGLNVVIGEVGTGKTTLCRELIMRLTPVAGQDQKQDQRLSTHLILDPSFKSPLEFLRTVSKLFGIEDLEEAKSEWQLKEHIKQYLFRQGVDADAIVVLVIDEGQKLPLFCVEILREFLNYETNDRKLLQIIIFAQEEFRQILKKRANFADRINERFHIGPLSLLETIKMIRFRLARASGNGKPPRLFTLPGFLAIHRATGGYPRRIITLCHQVVLSLIIMNRAKADWFTVRACVRRAVEERKGNLRWRRALGFSIIALCAAAAAIFYQHSFFAGQAVLETGLHQPVNLVAVPAPDLAITTVATVTRVVDEREDLHAVLKSEGAPHIMGSVRAREGETFARILRNVYGALSRQHYQSVVEANPHIENVDMLKKQEVVILPVIAMTSQLPASRYYWVRIASFGDIEEAYALLKSYPRDYPPIRLLPYWSRHEGMAFAIVLHNGFEDTASDRQTAIEMATRLPRVLASKARIMTAQPETIFLKRIIN